MRLIDEQYTACPFYGSRRMTEWLTRGGEEVNRKRVRRLMRTMGLEAIYPKPRLSAAGRGHKIYPYLLRGVKIERADQVGRVPGLLNSRKGQPLLQRPDVIGEARRHRRSPVLPPAIFAPLPQRAHRPAEVVSIHRVVSHRLVDSPVLAEPIRPSRLPRVAAPVRGVLPLDERGIDRPAARRVLEDPFHLREAARHHPAPGSPLADRRVQEARDRAPLGQEPRPARPACRPGHL